MPRRTPGQQKRKEPASELEAPPPSKRPLVQQDHNAGFRFFELPRELRDEIYKHVLDSAGVVLKPRSIISESGLLLANSQICEEFLDAILFYAPTIYTTVRNHNFAHIVTFLNRLPEEHFKRFQSTGTEACQKSKVKERKIHITLVYTPTKTSTRQQLNRWLDRFDDPNRRGAEINFVYKLDRSTWSNGGYKQRPSVRSTSGPRSKEETLKIIHALRMHRWPYMGQLQH